MTQKFHRQKRCYKKHERRNYNDPVYKKFRTDVKERDHNRCRWPGCKNSYKLQVHHILKWADYPNLRFAIANGITLCKFHHKLVKGQENYFIQFFQNILFKGSIA